MLVSVWHPKVLSSAVFVAPWQAMILSSAVFVAPWQAMILSSAVFLSRILRAFRPLASLPEWGLLFGLRQLS
jgi:hypothetical protein